MTTANLLVRAAAGLLVGTLLVLSGIALAEQSQSEEPWDDHRRSTPRPRNPETQRRESRPPERFNQRYDSRRGGRAPDSRRGPEHIAQTDVPDHLVDVILARPTQSGVTLSVLAYADMCGKVLYGTESGQLDRETPLAQFISGEPVELAISSLHPGTKYYYRLHYQTASASGLVEGSFHTQRPPGSTFAFTIVADSHLDQNTSPELYAVTLENALADRPDFHVDLGDTFMTGKYRGDEPAELYLAQRYYCGLLCHSAPLFFVLGNHDGEPGGRGRSRTGALALRKKYFPNPEPDMFYTGNDRKEEGAGLLQDYFAWQWGDALFVVLDPFWHSGPKRGQKDANWTRTLGREQYLWLRATLKASRARFKFVFIHHLVGGADSNGRGGIEAAKYFEWGGSGSDGRYEFNTRRPGWEMPIHQMLVENNVSVVFHGHDHFFAKQNLDDIVYQLLPQPGHGRYGSVRSATEYGYVEGEILAGSGHLRVSVSPQEAVVDFILSVLPEDERGNQRNAAVAYSYTLTPGVNDKSENAAEEESSNITTEPARSVAGRLKAATEGCGCDSTVVGPVLAQ